MPSQLISSSPSSTRSAGPSALRTTRPSPGTFAWKSMKPSPAHNEVSSFSR
ncbi:hypothetical protein [Paludisphaera mucosa]|uniref:Uncharacterized protein n=1 Tax=Paludisphaera mucosa TaxID=3030827 RepID=A0ABT6FGS8_9BACT|nr:hypothetical protein [Paludisphaera mucosa]MDG3006787.1 hypothetical protein [Paludisphaera mucosa]